jgi:2-desacetyl-2-hydroxyethyl bacteriochlorophyllide A dehydrogenase
MRAAVYQGAHDITVEDVPTPALGDDDVLVKIDYCGVCGSDLHFVIEGWGQPGSVHGHEWSGVVAGVGPAVGNLKPGDRVVGGPDPCGTCQYCTGGRSSLCRNSIITADADEKETGAYAQFKKSSSRSVNKIPDGLDQRAAALTEPLAIAMHAITRSGVKPTDRVLVTGAGPIGLLTIATLKAQGIDDITASEPADARRERAFRVGASTVITPDELPDVPLMPMAVVDEPYDVVFECSGNAKAMEQALGQLGPAGTFVVVGTGMKRPRWDPNRILLLELVVTGAYNYDDNGFPAALELLASGKLPIDDLAEPDDTPLEGLLDAMERLARGELTRKVLVRP